VKTDEIIARIALMPTIYANE